MMRGIGISYCIVGCMCLNGMLAISCGTMMKEGYQPLVVEPVKGQGVVLESTKKIFVTADHKTVKKTKTFFSGDEDDSSSVEESTEVQYFKKTWIPPDENSVLLALSPKGQSQKVKVYCNCVLKDKGTRRAGGKAYLEKQCGGSSKGKLKTVYSEKSTLLFWLNMSSLGIGLIVDYFTGGLYDYKPLNLSKTCSA